MNYEVKLNFIASTTEIEPVLLMPIQTKKESLERQ